MSQAQLTASAQESQIPEVMTRSELAKWLRVSEDQVVTLATRRGLPGQRIDGEWRFLRRAVQDWLARPSRAARILQHAGAVKDDPQLDQMLEQIYQDRGRPMIEDET